MPAQTPTGRVALALGGGARGYAHIGVISELRSRGYEVVGVAGSSMGALVGGLHAAGSLDEFAEWATTLTQRAVLAAVGPVHHSCRRIAGREDPGRGPLSFGDATIEDLPILISAVTDRPDGGQVGLL